MSEFKGTSGQWKFKKEYEAEFIKLYIIDKDENILFDSGNRTYLEEETEYDFNLASKAPQMLEMLKDILDQNKQLWGEYESRTYQITEVEQLIKEATELK